MYFLKKTEVFSLMFLLCFSLHWGAKAQSSPHTDWFTQARYGMFIHWGLYSAAEGLWKGENLRYMNDYAEWIRYRNRISKAEYGKLAKRFQWDNINPEEWVKLAKAAGMKYIIMTTKHHEGVAIWDTQVNDYSLPKLAGVDRDIIKELAEACRKYDMKLGFYYSHWIDWAHPYGWDHNQELTGKVTDEQYNQYWQEKVIPQIRELLTNYGDIAIMWFDMWIPYQESIIQKKQLVQLAKMIRELQPNCLINSRLGLAPASQYVDFETLGDNSFGTNYVDHPWETPGTIAHSWGYNGQDNDYKSVSQIFASLIGNVSLNGNYTLNIGPRADGSVPFESAERLRIIGDWLKNYGEAVYGTTGLGVRPGGHDWGRITYQPKTKTIYLHVFNWPLDQILRLTGLTSTPESVVLMKPKGEEVPLNYTQNGPFLHIEVPNQPPNPYDAVVKIKVNRLQLDTAVVAESSFGGFSLSSLNVEHKETLDISPYDGKHPTFAKITDQIIHWKLYLPKGDYHLDFSGHNPTGQAVKIKVDLGKKHLSALIQPDGKVVAEPNEHNYTDEFVDHRLGEFKIKNNQFIKVEFSMPNEEELWFNHLWIAPNVE